jgi:O-acetylhomoserine/O-acetylserine sulfhydrylase-like pyridoxal-dependent enzyme
MTTKARLRQLSPLRVSSKKNSVKKLVKEQLRHFGISPKSETGRCLKQLCKGLYHSNVHVHELWQVSLQQLETMDRGDRIALFNAKRFVCFQIAKMMDNLQNPMRRNYQSLQTQGAGHPGPYPLFDNVTAIFSSTPVIVKTATYLYACTEWIDEAFQGREPLHEIYSRLMNPTSIALANYIVDIEAGPLASEYMAWNFNSGMAAIDTLLSHLVGVNDIVISSRNVYGGTYQLLNDWYGKRSNLNVAIEWFDGYTAPEFATKLNEVLKTQQERLSKGATIYIYLESPCNPHGYTLDVAEICRVAHKSDLTVICDATVGTPFLHPVLKDRELEARPDYVLHSYTKDLTGSGTTTAGVVIGRNETMFLPKGSSAKLLTAGGTEREIQWSDTLFWNVFYIKGAFLDSEKSFNVIEGMRTLELRMLRKCITTLVLAKVLDRHPGIQVHSAALKTHFNYEVNRKNMFLGLPAPLFTIDFSGSEGRPEPSRSSFKRFFDSLEPTFGLQVSLGQVNTVVLCPALTSHSEMSEEALAEAGIHATTIRIAVGDEDPRKLLAHMISASKNSIDESCPGFSHQFMKPDDIDRIYQKTYVDVHRNFANHQSTMAQMLC